MSDTRYVTIKVPAGWYEDHDDCLAAAERHIQASRHIEGWNLDPRWEDDQREMILLDIPLFSALADELEG